jgi:Na+/H+ antiporter NhaA
MTIMKKNMGSTDKLIRLLVAIILIALYYTNVLKDTLGIVSLIVALVLTITSLISFCPLYAIFGIKTCKKEE